MVAVDLKASTYFADDEAVAIWIHEIGHLLGLRHNPSAASLMFYIVYATNEFDSADLRALASLHSFRPIHAIQYSTVDEYGSRKEIHPRQALSK
jgi:Matrixin